MGYGCLRCVSGMEFLVLSPITRLRSSSGSDFRRKGKCILECGGPWHHYESPRFTEGWGASIPISSGEPSQVPGY